MIDAWLSQLASAISANMWLAPLMALLAGVLASPLCAAGLDAQLTLVDGSTDDVRVNLTLTNTGDKPIDGSSSINNFG